MSAIDDLFSRLKQDGKKAFMPFITAADPNLDLTTQLLSRLDQAGCHLCELGIPYSDPIADGPVIQASYTRALNNGARLENIFQSVGQLHQQLTMPLVSMVSYAIIYRKGLDAYLDQAIKAGIAGAIVPDMPADEADEFADRCGARDFSLVQLITPTTSRERAKQIARQSTGFIYYVSVTGITGERQALPEELKENLGWLRTQTELPICVGFGISSPDQVQQLKPVCDGIIVGSAIVRRIAKASAGTPESEVLQDVESFCKQMLDALA